MSEAEKEPTQPEPANPPEPDLPAGKKPEPATPPEPDKPAFDAEAFQKELKKSQDDAKKSQEELKKIKEGFKKLFGDEEEAKKKKEDPNSELKEYMQEQFKQINARLDEKEHEEVMDSLSSNFDLKTPEQKEFFEFKIMKAQEEKGEALSEKEITAIGESVKKLHATKEASPKGSSVVENDGGPAIDIGSADNITYKKFQEMGLMERGELFKVNKNLYEKFIVKEQEEALKVN